MPPNLLAGPTSKGRGGEKGVEGKVKRREGEVEEFVPPKNFCMAPPMYFATTTTAFFYFWTRKGPQAIRMLFFLLLSDFPKFPKALLLDNSL